jgi:hypothetical protein
MPIINLLNLRRIMMDRFIWCVATFFASMIWVSPSFAQGGNLNEVLQCTLKPGFSLEEVVSVGKAIPRNENGPNLVFYREPIVAPASRTGSINVVRYWDNFEHMIRGLESQTPSGPSQHFFAMVDCAGTRSVGRNMSVVEQGTGAPYEGGDADESYVAIRQCTLNSGNDMQDVMRLLSEFDMDNRADGDRTSYGVLQILASGQDGEMNTAFAIRAIGENAIGLGRRLDAMPWSTADSDSPATCGSLSLWKSYVIHWGN